MQIVLVQNYFSTVVTICSIIWGNLFQYKRIYPFVESSKNPRLVVPEREYKIVVLIYSQSSRFLLIPNFSSLSPSFFIKCLSFRDRGGKMVLSTRSIQP